MPFTQRPRCEHGEMVTIFALFLSFILFTPKYFPVCPLKTRSFSRKISKIIRISKLRPLQSSPCPLSVVSLFVAAVIQDQLQSKNITWKIPEVNNSWVVNCMPFWLVWWNLVLLTLSHQRRESPLCPTCPASQSISRHLFFFFFTVIITLIYLAFYRSLWTILKKHHLTPSCFSDSC